MTDEMRVREGMRQDLRAASAVIREQTRRIGPDGEERVGPASAVWVRFVRYGLFVEEELFQQWRARTGRLMPLVSRGATAEAFVSAGVAERTENGVFLDALAWRRFCKAAETRPPSFDISVNADDSINAAASNAMDLKAYLFLQENSIRARRKARLRRSPESELTGFSPDPEHMTDAEVEASLGRAKARRGAPSRPRQERTVPLPTNPDDPWHWMPWASAPASIYWLWRWGVTKDKLRAAIRTHAQWAVDYKHGFLLTDMAAVRWAWDRPLPANPRGTFGQAMAALGADIRRPTIERKMREQLVELMFAAESVAWGEDFSHFDAAMAIVREKTRRLIEQGDAAPHVPVKQLHRWFGATTMEITS